MSRALILLALLGSGCLVHSRQPAPPPTSEPAPKPLDPRIRRAQIFFGQGLGVLLDRGSNDAGYSVLVGVGTRPFAGVTPHVLVWAILPRGKDAAGAALGARWDFRPPFWVHLDAGVADGGTGKGDAPALGVAAGVGPAPQRRCCLELVVRAVEVFADPAETLMTVNMQITLGW